MNYLSQHTLNETKDAIRLHREGNSQVAFTKLVILARAMWANTAVYDASRPNNRQPFNVVCAIARKIRGDATGSYRSVDFNLSALEQWN